MINFASEEDVSALKAIDPIPTVDAWKFKILAQEVIVFRKEGIEALLRFEVLWTTVPFISYVYVSPKCRGQGISRSLLTFLENELVRRGFVALLSSSQTDDVQAQKWHVHVGFHTNGIIENIADDNVGEIVFRKMLSKD